MKRNAFNCALIFALLAAIMLSMVGFKSSCDEMYDNIIRIRIIANSDSAEDQALKIKIRDDVLSASKNLFGKANSYDDAVRLTSDNLDLLLNIAQNTVYQNNYNYDVKIELRDEFFDTRVYDGFTLPAGTYKTAVFTVGAGEGENWWCVIFPQVCVGACSGKLEDTISNESSNYAYNAENYTVKFKMVEIFEKVKKYLFF